MDAPNTAPFAMGNPMAQPGLGVPVGGLGAGSFMINQAGTFGPWNMGGSINANYENRILPQAALHVRAQAVPPHKQDSGSQSGTPTAQTRSLAVNTKDFGSVSPAFKTLDAGAGTYSALYPFGQIDYRDPVPDAQVSTKFWTPIVAGNDKLSSQPVAYFDVTITNNAKKTRDISTMLTWPNAPAHVAAKVQSAPSSEVSKRTGYYSKFQRDAKTGVAGVVLGASSPSNTPDSQNSEWTVAARPQNTQKMSYTTSWDGNGSGADVYKAFTDRGALPNRAIDDSASAGAIVLSAKLKPKQSTTMHYVLAWDFPQISFSNPSGTQQNVWMRRYTEFYGAKSDHTNRYVPSSYPGRQAFSIADRNLTARSSTLAKVNKWWEPYAHDASVSPAVRRAGLNELNQLTFNSSFWESGLVSTNGAAGPGARIGSRTPGTHLFHTITGGGWYDSGELNVQMQAAKVTRQLFPSIEKDWTRAQAQMVMQDPNGRVPDSPGGLENPWLGWQGSSEPAAPKAKFSDTPMKFILRAYAAYEATGDHKLLRDVYPALKRAWQNDVLPRIPAGQALLPDPGTFANTYDILGQDDGSVDIYTSGLYALTAEAMIAATEDAEDLGVTGILDTRALRTRLTATKSAIEANFWTGTYYRFTNAGHKSTDVFADAIWPQYAAQQMNLPDVLPMDRVAKHLKTVYPIMKKAKDAKGRLSGAPNLIPITGEPYGFLPPGYEFQAPEVWTGTNFGVAATYIEIGRRLKDATLISYGRQLGSAVSHQIYDPKSISNGSYAFNTPEAWQGTDPTTYRAANYVRALAAWDLLEADAR
ncbi:GH116 family glycosyl-hydrolase [Streptomyces sp. NPDC005485]|uniref:GH116 family glycosyl-hydrolase n=1 Tax=Streptomyces sp. NPDC005485 TaxID=3155591 RepID=UPI0033A275CE